MVHKDDKAMIEGSWMYLDRRKKRHRLEEKFIVLNKQVLTSHNRITQTYATEHRFKITHNTLVIQFNDM